MDTLNYDITNIIFKQIPAMDQLQLSKVFNEPRPSQFHVSSELMASKDLYGYKGLIMRAITTPNECLYDMFYNMIKEQIKIDNYEPCVQVMVQIQEQLHIDPWNTREDDVRKDFQKFRRQLIVLKNSITLALKTSTTHAHFDSNYESNCEWYMLIDIICDFMPDTYTDTDADTDTYTNT